MITIEDVIEKYQQGWYADPEAAPRLLRAGNANSVASLSLAPKQLLVRLADLVERWDKGTITIGGYLEPVSEEQVELARHWLKSHA